MTDRLKGLIVAFESDIRDDDAQCIIDAILMIKGVTGVTAELSNTNDYINRQRLKREITDKLYKVIRDI